MATVSSGPPPSRATVYSRTLLRASDVLGGVEPLAQHLRVSPTQLAQWIDGRGQPPTDVFLAAVDVVLRTV
jgi:DNA-binding transcriptional regulator YdaS (Cro superfamily)